MTEILAAVVGAILAVVGGFWAQHVGMKRQEARWDRESEEQEKALRDAIFSEVEVLWQHYMSDIGMELELTGKGTALRKKYSVNGGYFRVYKENAGQLGRIRDREQRAYIINFYVKAEAMLDMIRQQNELVEEVRKKEAETGYDLSAPGTPIARYNEGMRFHHGILKDAARSLIGSAADAHSLPSS